MATSTSVPWYYERDRNNDNKTNNFGQVTNTKVNNNYHPHSQQPTNFPDKFQDFFGTLKEDIDDLPAMLEDKLIPR